MQGRDSSLTVYRLYNPLRWDYVQRARPTCTASQFGQHSFLPAAKGTSTLVGDAFQWSYYAGTLNPFHRTFRLTDFFVLAAKCSPTLRRQRARGTFLT